MYDGKKVVNLQLQMLDIKQIDVWKALKLLKKNFILGGFNSQFILNIYVFWFSWWHFVVWLILHLHQIKYVKEARTSLKGKSSLLRLNTYDVNAPGNLILKTSCIPTILIYKLELFVVFDKFLIYLPTTMQY